MMEAYVNRRLLVAGLGIAGMTGPLVARAGTMADSTPAMADYRKGTLTISTISRRASEIASKRASAPHVLGFAKLELAEQVTVGQVLTNTQTPPLVALDAADSDAIEHLGSLPIGQQFDEAYVAAEISGHQKLLGIQETFLSRERLGSDCSHIAFFLRTFIHEHLQLLGYLQKA
jgi:putative membrane protein